METLSIDNYEPVVRIVIIGVGGAGNNAVGRMIDDNISNVEFYVANTDLQALSQSKCPNKILLGPSNSKGLGAGGDPHRGEELTKAAADRIREVVTGADIVFIAAGMGGGTGTGGAPIVAQIAREEGALTVAIVTRPFHFEGDKRLQNSTQGLNKLMENIDSIIVVSNEKSLHISGNLTMIDAFMKTDSVLSNAVKTVVNLILVPAIINMDFADVMTVLKNGGLSLISMGVGKGVNKVSEATNSTLNSPLLEGSVFGATKAIIAIT
ncbi:MAG: cell division protein FtsZ, partial [Erysipelotrichaceae bacterium]|nr:cell division protein FtsZ [Erysipelotrichaceae bacterium]